MDQTTGDPILNEYNNTIPVDDRIGFQQIIDGLFHCTVGSERMNPFYGFDLESAIRGSSDQTPEMFIESLVIQSLNPEVEKLISSINDVLAERDETDGRQINVVVNLTSVLGDSLTIEQTIGD